MLTPEEIAGIADELAGAAAGRRTVPLLTARHPQMTVEDAYAVQRLWCERGRSAGRRLGGHKIGLTSKVMQAATGITEPDYGAIFADMIFESGTAIDAAPFVGLRLEVELAFVLAEPLTGTDVTVPDVLRATSHVQPAVELLSSRIDLAGRTIVDTIADNAAMGAMVLGGRPVRPDDVNLPRVGTLLYRNGTVEESGLAGAVLGHPAAGVAWLAGKLAAHGDGLTAGEVILSGSFTRPIWIEPGDVIHADYGELGAVTCRFT